MTAIVGSVAGVVRSKIELVIVIVIDDMKVNDMHRFLIIIEKSGANFSAWSPDLPGCVATGKTRERTAKTMHEAIEFHIQGLREDGQPVPKGQASAEYVAVP